ncbi:unnamed protein product [Ixodes persulcatus]
MEIPLLARPKRGETDEELLRMQDDFLKSGGKPSVEVVRSSKSRDRPEHGDAANRGTPSNASKPPPQVEASATESLSDVSLASVLCDVVERSVEQSSALPPTAPTTSFPEVEQLEVLGPPPPVGHKSLFALRAKRSNSSSGPRDSDVPQTSFGPVSNGGALAPSDREAIHAENLERLQNMSHAEKVQARDQLLARLDPTVISFLRSRRDAATKPGCSPEDRAPTKLGLCPEDAAAVLPKKPHDSLGSTGEERPTEKCLSLDESELPIRPSEAAQRWLHMDQVEEEKLEWMTMLPPAKEPDSKDPIVGRFDFEGNLVSPSAEIPTHRGLHHHGDSPQAAGYSTAEILQFLRSSVRSQRLLALQLLERMLTKHWEGHYAGLLAETDLADHLLGSGLAPLLRSALDDRSTLDAALAALRALVVSRPQEEVLKRAFLWCLGHRSPFLQPAKRVESTNELTDLELSQADIVKALLRMDLLTRLSYVLRKCCPGANAVASTLLILARMARHSLQSATKILDHPGLMELVFEQFLPQHWGSPAVMSGKMAQAYGSPMWSALELVRSLAAAGRSLADTLLQRYPLEESLSAYLALDPSASRLPGSDCLCLALEAVRTWRVLLAYELAGGLCLALFPVVARRLQLCSCFELDGEAFDLEYGACLLHCLATLPAEVAREAAQGLGSILESCCGRWADWLARSDRAEASAEGVSLVAAAVHCLAALRVPELRSSSPCATALVSLLRSQRFATLSTALMNSSLLTRATEPKEHNLIGRAPCVAGGFELGNHCVSPPGISLLVASLARLLHIATTTSPDDPVWHQARDTLLCNVGIASYLRRLVGPGVRQAHVHCLHWCSGAELDMLHELVLLAACTPLQNKDDTLLWHQVSLTLVGSCAPGFEDRVFSLLLSVVFRPEFARAEDTSKRCKNASDIDACETLTSVTGSPVSTPADPCDDQQLAAVRNIYLDAVRQRFPKRELQALSLNWAEHPLLPVDWPYLPLEALCAEDVIPGACSLHAVLGCLRWVALLLRQRPQVLAAVPPLVHYCRLASVFLAGPDVFLDAEVQGLLLLVLRLLRQRKLLCATQKDLDLRGWPGLLPFSDFFPRLLEQFAGESYGDVVFACWLLVPLQAECDPHFRRLLFAEHPEALPLIRLLPSQSVVPLGRFLEPAEEDPVVLETYANQLLSGKLTPDKTPMLFEVATHGVASFVRSRADSPLGIRLLSLLQHGKHHEAAQKVLSWERSTERPS